jgi:hypothetical protein
MINKNCETRETLWVPRTLARPLSSGIAVSGLPRRGSAAARGKADEYRV